MGQSSRIQHVLVLPFPLQGHVNPLLTVAKLLAPRGFTFTFVVPQHLTVPLPASAGDGGPIQFVTVPADPGDEGPRPSADTRIGLQQVLSMVESMQAGCVDLLRELSSSNPVSCILVDSFVTWSFQVSSQFALPLFVFVTTNAHTEMIAGQESGSMGVTLTTFVMPIADPEQRFDDLDGLPALCARDLPMSLREVPQFPAKQVEYICDAAGVILNTVEDFEKKPLDTIRRKVAAYTIGPMLLMEQGTSSSSSSSSSLSMWTEDKQCLSWLDSMPASSVLYVSFGSIATMSVEQIRELAEGLDASGVHFLWVIRPNAVSAADSPLLSDSFYERTRDRGLVITWAPQLAVLSHPSTGGFLTHCGWNSITENLSLSGVPMICWPQVAEQRLNARMLVDEWRIGLELLHKADEGSGLVKRAVIDRAARDLMQGEVGKELRKRAAQLKDIACQAVQEGGSSLINLEALITAMQKRP